MEFEKQFTLIGFRQYAEYVEKKLYELTSIYIAQEYGPEPGIYEIRLVLSKPLNLSQIEIVKLQEPSPVSHIVTDEGREQIISLNTKSYQMYDNDFFSFSDSTHIIKEKYLRRYTHVE